MAGAAHAEILIGSVSIVHEKAGLNKVLNDRLGPITVGYLLWFTVSFADKAVIYLSGSD